MRARDGKIKADCFSEKRLLGFPPGVGVLLIMFNRFHNYVVEQLATINEGGRFTKPANETDVAANAKYDNDLFQTGRLITCGLYVNIILKDYVRTILNLNRTNSVWDLDPRTEENKSIFESPAAEGVGNQVSAEFNLVYRWHSAVSERDDKWTQQAFQALFPGKDPSQLKVPELIRGLAKWEDGLPGDPQERPFANLQRADDGTLPDDALAEILSSSVEDVAGAFGANNVPMILRPVEILGIIQARSWNLATLNEFRAFFGLTKHETFEDINSSKDVADQLRHLYDEPDLVELYPGLVVEEAKAPMVPGSGLCASFTASRAILSDAVALVRGDRFFTTDYTPNKLTSWGYNEANYDLAVNQGCVIYKLILRAFPQHFKPNSVYAHYPFVIPSENKEILTKLERELQYDFSKPTYIPLPTLILTHSAAKKILDNQNDFKVIWGESITHLMGHGGKEYGYDFMLSGDRPANANSRCIMGRALYKDAWKDEVEAFYRNITLQLLRSKSYQIAGINQVDIVRDVGNLAQAHFAAEVFSLPLKTEKNPHAIFAEEELYLLMAVVFASIFYDADPAKSFPLRQVARTVTQELGSLVEEMVEPLNATAFLAKQIERFHTQHTLSTYGTHLIRELLTSNLGPKDIVWSQMLPAAGGMVANQGQLFAQCLDFYLDDDQKAHLTEIQRLAKLDTDEADELLMR
jgi:linoleate 8R-lipoxygenase/9,12-octadecadienoate 8-hydroperoxide 8R-isomerase